MVDYRINFLDIEVLQEGSRFPDPKKAERPVICLTIYDNYEDKYFTLFQHPKYQKSGKVVGNHVIFYMGSEIELFKTLNKINREIDPDLIVGWNIDFDRIYLENRAKVLGFDNIYEDVQFFDLMSAYAKIFNPRSKSLSYVAEKEDFAGKTILTSDIPYYYDKDPEQIIIYNKHDVELLKLIEERHKIIEFYISMKEYVGTPDINDCFMFSILLDTVLLRMAKERGIVLPNKRQGTGEWYPGAIVFEPVGGLHKNVAVLDMNRYYPSIILTYEISPDGCGLVLDMVRFLNEQRNRLDEELKKLDPGSDKYNEIYNKRQVVKDLLNAVYGFIGYERSRIYHKPDAELVTKVARDGLMWSKNQIERKGFKVIYGDTDSIFVKLPDEYTIEECVEAAEALAKEVTKSFDRFVEGRKHHFTLEFEKIFNPLLMLPETKKRYAGKVVWEKGKSVNYVQVKGLEIRRSDTAEITANIQMKVIELLLDGKHDEAVEYVRDVIKQIRNGEVSPYELAINVGIQKKIASYGISGGIPWHIRAVMYSNRYLGTNFDKGDKVKVLYVKGVKGLPNTDVIAFTDDMKLPDVVIDYDKMIEVTVRSKVEKLLNVVGIDWNKVEKRGLWVKV